MERALFVWDMVSDVLVAMALLAHHPWWALITAAILSFPYLALSCLLGVGGVWELLAQLFPSTCAELTRSPCCWLVLPLSFEPGPPYFLLPIERPPFSPTPPPSICGCGHTHAPPSQIGSAACTSWALQVFIDFTFVFQNIAWEPASTRPSNKHWHADCGVRSGPKRTLVVVESSREVLPRDVFGICFQAVPLLDPAAAAGSHGLGTDGARRRGWAGSSARRETPRFSWRPTCRPRCRATSSSARCRAVAFRVTSSVHFYSSTLTHTCPRRTSSTFSRPWRTRP